MGTRADFYVGRGKDAEWLGSIAYDGYLDGHPARLIRIGTERGFRRAVAGILASVDHSTPPNLGWPWPWDTSHTTDFSYAWDRRVYMSCFGSAWRTVKQYSRLGDTGRDRLRTMPSDAFPDMSSRKNVTMGPRSGLLMISVPR